jgi:Protein of unknown function (DUF1553)/Protein of unknown function (DUF1549)/Planctomycete cytochrome C/Concanavalin A-like lectin/glucanases superfamily
MGGRFGSWIGAAFVAALCAASYSQAEVPPEIDFNRDIRPILSDNCFQCHGPDAAARQGELRLDREEDAVAARKEGAAIVRGKPAESELVRRITHANADERMPPADSGKQLSAVQIELLHRWVEQGAKWQAHWSFIPPKRPLFPEVSDSQWLRSGLDAFILHRLDRESLKQSPEAPKATLLRRVSLDLTGLPPTLAEVKAFLADASPDAYERAVDRLLASPRYGERMAVRWLDAARYADTNGYQTDAERVMWRWRDWVIEAFNQDMPFDQFTVEQLAGDLLPKPTLDQRIATGFNRNHRGNAEGGIIPEEYAVEYVVDRVETTSTVWLGVTLGCARCHDHKFDPFKQKEFYSLYAFFNSVPENGRAVKFGNSPPFILAPTRTQLQEIYQLQDEKDKALEEWTNVSKSQFESLSAWLSTFKPRENEDYVPTEGLLATIDFDAQKPEHRPRDPDIDSQTKPLGTSAASILNAKKTAPFPTLRIAEGAPSTAEGVRGKGLVLDGNTVVEAGNVGDFGLFDEFVVSAWVWIDEGGGGTVVSRMTDVYQGNGYQLAVVNGKVQFNVVQRWLDDAILVESTKAISPGSWHHLLAIYRGLRAEDVQKSISLYIDGEPDGKALLAELNQPFNVKEPLRIGGGGGPKMRFRGKIDEVRIYAGDFEHVALTKILPVKESVAEIVKQSDDAGRGPRFWKLLQYYQANHAPESERAKYERFQKSLFAMNNYQRQLPTVMVMEELSEPRQAYVLLRGQYDHPGEKVERAVPASLSLELPTDTPRNRLGLAKWLVDPAHPLTARVAVNRFWQMYFGAGLVKTAEDFGSQGEWPTHPELLDWLATEFSVGDSTLARRASEGAWDIKRMQRLIVTSSTYRQSSHIATEAAGKDPENRLLARGPRIRLSAEMIRDQALAASGLLVEQLGGPSVMPYQPPGLWTELTGGEDYKPGKGADLYRRSLYTFWKRTIAPPAMLAFDASTREFCTVRENRTNTPLQALALLNEQTFVEATHEFAKNTLALPLADDSARLIHMFQTATSREPTSVELEVLVKALDKQRSLAKGDNQQAFTAIASLLLNLDETVVKE